MTQTAPIAVQPMQWGVLRELQDISPLDASDAACMIELRDVLARHGKLGRFALHLAHRHFDLAPGEVLIERPDPDGRTQHVTVGQLGDFPDAVPTTWLLDDGPELSLSGTALYCVCVSTPISLGGCVRHGKSHSPGPAAEREEAARERHIGNEKARYEQGFPTGGHDRNRNLDP